MGEGSSRKPLTHSRSWAHPCALSRRGTIAKFRMCDSLGSLDSKERQMIRNQQSFIEAFASAKLGRNERLEQVARQVKWYRFEKLLRKLEPEAAGRPPFEPLLMFKALLLQQWYALSDAQLEEAL